MTFAIVKVFPEPVTPSKVWYFSPFFFRQQVFEFFVSYYDYYQPEAYIPQTDTFIEKNSLTNDEIDKLRHSATFALLERKDVKL